MKIKMEISMNDSTKKHEIVEVKNYIEAHQKMHKKYKGQYHSTLIDKVIE
ncbi:MAG TPA: hypothetical protein GXZ90_09965 [Clostridiales bacterium]|nr:hypothetical protein [Clostridiales bacterium]